MFEAIRDRLSGAFAQLRGKRVITEAHLDTTLRDVRRALLEADVALPVVKDFISRVKERAANADVLASLTPDQTILKVVHEELTAVIGQANVPLDLGGPKPAVILIAGLQGSGKTTTAAKLAKLLKNEKKSALLVSTDVYRPAAIDQLKTLADMIQVDFFETGLRKAPVKIAKSAIRLAKKRSKDVVIVDTAGRLHIDKDMMSEIQAIYAAIKPTETLFVIDAMTGHDAVVSAAAFNEALSLTGVIVTKLDSDTRGGALLSARHVTGKPVKFIGEGESLDALDHFHPDRIASRLLGMGDIKKLIDSVQQKADESKAKKLEKKIKQGRGFNLEDYRDQMMLTQDMGGISAIAKLMPGIPTNALSGIKAANKDVNKEVAIINSMTPHERRFPAVIRGSRRTRISKGAGVTVRDVNLLLRKFNKFQKMTRRVLRGKGKLEQMPELEAMAQQLRMRR